MRMGMVSAALAGGMLMAGPGALRAAGPPPGGGTVFVTAENASEADPTPTQTAVNAATAALGAKGFTFLEDPGHAAYVADVVVSRTDVGMGQEKVHAGAAAVMGTGVSVPFATGQSRLVPLERTEMDIRIRRRGEKETIWYGAAVTVRSAGAADGTPERVASVLSAAALRLYPRQSAETVGVP